MTQEEKQLLFQDLCARLPYGVITKNCKNDFDVPANLLPHVNGNGIKSLIDEYDLKPYLRPMSSMTEEEKKELCSVIESEVEDMCNILRRGDCGIKEGKYHFNHLKELDWLNTYHFDYRDLIPKGLALEAPKEMYKTY